MDHHEGNVNIQGVRRWPLVGTGYRQRLPEEAGSQLGYLGVAVIRPGPGHVLRHVVVFTSSPGC